MPKAFSESEKEWIHTRLLEQGYKLFSAYGLKKTNVDEITRAAGISKGAFYAFYDSKEALFMEVVEQAETRIRQQILTLVDQPGLSPRARLVRVLKEAITLLKGMPMLQIFSGSDYDLLFRRLPPEKLQQHLSSDQVFLQQLVSRCQAAGIPIAAPLEQIAGLLYSLITMALHEDPFGSDQFSGNADVLVELIAAFCLGEIKVEAAEESSSKGRK